MNIENKSIEEYIAQLPSDRQIAIQKLREVIKSNLPCEFNEEISYGMIGYVVPLSFYPAGYHCKPNTPLPFISVASTKGHIGLYHLGLYSDEDLMRWFKAEFVKHSSAKLDMGKSCIRFKKVEQIPYNLIGELCTKMSVDKWIEIYETNYKR